jgi:hypothetical protein
MANRFDGKNGHSVALIAALFPAALAVAFLHGCSKPLPTKKPAPDSGLDGQLVLPEPDNDAGVESSVEVAPEALAVPDTAPPPDGCPLAIADPAGFQPVALYRLDESGGAAVVDSSGHGAGGTIFNGIRGPGACGRGVTLDDPEARLELPAIGDIFAGGIAVELWLRPTSIQRGRVHLIGDGGGGLASFQLTLEDGFPAFRFEDSTTGNWRELLRSPVSVRAGAWQHVRAVYDGDTGNGKLFIDGIEVSRTNRIVQVQGSYNRIYVGAVLSIDPCCSLTNQLAGDIDEIAIWRR